jgi:hypothetical protein
MRTLTVYRHGLTIGTAPTRNDHTRSLRDEVKGWSSASTRRNLAFLRTIDERKLDKDGFRSLALTLTLRDCPETASDWHAIRNAFTRRLNRLGLLRGHWVTEWQRRGVPHLHGCVWLPETISKSAIIQHWLELTHEKYGSSPKAQYILPITDTVGWFKYLSKHAARGVSHYQRSSANIPEGWQSKTGRVWGHVGDWPTAEPIKITLESEGFYRFRRLCRAWRKADARARITPLLNKLKHTSPVSVLLDPAQQFRMCGASFAIRSARTALKCPDRSLSSVRGASEWISGETSHQFLTFLLCTGSAVALRSTDSEKDIQP